MGRTVPSFRNVLAEEKQEWKPFRNALSKSDKKSFDEMWDIPKLYIMACSGSVSLVPFHPIAISILFHHYKELMECQKQINKLMDNDKNSDSHGFICLKEYLENEIGVEHYQIEEEQLTLFEF
jgi:hypothetical protein